MPQVSIDSVPEACRNTVQQAMEYEGISRAEAFNRFAPGHRREWTWFHAPNAPPFGTGRGPKQIRMIDARCYSRGTPGQPGGYERWHAAAIAGAFTAPGKPPGGDGGAAPVEPGGAGPAGGVPPATTQAAPGAPWQPQLRFCSDQVAALNLPTAQLQKLVDERLEVVKLFNNGRWKLEGCASKGEWGERLAARLGISVRSLHRIVRNYELHGIRGLDLQRPGPDSTGAGSRIELGRSENAWMRAAIELDYRNGLSKAGCWRRLCDEISARQAKHGQSHLYSYVPTLEQVKAYLRDFERRQPPVRAAREAGAAGLQAAAGYLDREIDEPAGDCWCIDEWKVDAHVFCDWRPADVVRPFIITIIDERSECVLGWKLVLDPNREAVLDLAESTLRNYWKPRRFYSDRGSHFTQAGKIVKLQDNDKVLGAAAGALSRMGIHHIGPKRKNPRANRIERKLHGFYAARALADLAGSASGSTADQAQALGVYERVAEHEKLCREGDVFGRTRLVSFRALEALIPAWIERYNTTPSEANGLSGLAPLSAFRTFSPDEDAIAERRVSEEELLVKFAQYFEDVTIRQGGIIDLGKENGQRRRYDAPELRACAGQKRTVFQLRHNDDFVVVEPLEGTAGARIIARRRTPVGILDMRNMQAAERERERIEGLLLERYAPQRGARRSAGNAGAGLEQAGLVGAGSKPAPTPQLEISSTEFYARRHEAAERARRARTLTSEEVALRALEMEGE